MSRTSARLLVLSLLVAAVSLPAYSATFLVPPDEEMIRAADAIVVAIAGSSRSEVYAGNVITTVTQLHVVEVLKGSSELLKTIEIRELGGFIDGKGMVIPGVPTYQDGAKYLVMVASEKGERRTWGWELGKFEFLQSESGKTILIRGVDDGGIAGFSVGLKEPHIERVRSTAFLDYIRALVSNRNAEVGYFMPIDYDTEVARAIGAPTTSAVSRAPYLKHVTPDGPERGLRRDGSTITFLTAGTQSSIDELAATDDGMDAWTNDSASNISLSRGGATNPSNQSSVDDDVTDDNDIVFTAAEPFPFTDANGIAWTAIYFGGSCCTHTTVDTGETFYSIEEADVIVKGSASSIGQADFAQMMTHELGHAIGFRHSNQNKTETANCSSPLPCSSSAIMKTTISGGYGASLQEWDSDAVQTVYGTGPVCTPVVINTSTPVDKTIPYNTSTKISVNINSGRGPLEFQWYEGVNPDTSKPVGVNDGNYTTGRLKSTKQFWARVWNACTIPGDVESRTATVTVQTCMGPVITTQPASATIESGQSKSLSVAASGSDILEYQWYRGESGDTSTPIGGATNKSYSTGTLTQTAKYWVKVSNDCGDVASLTATIAVGCELPVITVHPVGTTINAGETAMLSVTATGGTLSYQWFQVVSLPPDPNDPNAPTTGKVPVGTNAPTFMTPALSTTTSYFVEITNDCDTIGSQTAVITVIGPTCTNPVITTQPASTSILYGATATLFVAATSETPISYQWFDGTSGGPSVEIAGATTSSYNTGILTANRSYWVRLTNDCGSTDSSTAVVTTICRPPAAPTIAVVPAVTTSGSVFTISWEELPGVSTWQLDEATEPTFASPITRMVAGQSTNLSQIISTPTIFYYRVRGIADCDASLGAYSRTASISITAPPAADDPAPEASVPFGSGETVTFEIFLPGDLEPAKQASAVKHFTITPIDPWLTVDPSSGILPPEGTTVIATAETVDLPVGTTTTSVQIAITETPEKGLFPSNSHTSSIPVSVNLVTPVSPVASTTPSASSIIIPGVAHAAGTNSQWQSDIRIVNTELLSQSLQLNFTPQGVDGSQRVQSTSIDVLGGGTTALNDILKNWFGQGAIGVGNLGSLEIRPSGGSAKSANEIIALATVASSRTFNVSSAGTFGQFLPGIPFSRFFGDNLDGGGPAVQSMQQIIQNDSFRTNVAIIEAAGEPATGVIKIFSGDGTELRQVPFQLAPAEYKPFNGLLASQGITSDNARVEVHVTSSTGRVTAWASVADNFSQDPILVPAKELSNIENTKWVLPGVADFVNAINSWRTDIRIFNSEETTVNATMTFYPQNNPAGAIVRNITLLPGTVTEFNSVLRTTFNVENTGGSVHVETSVPTSLVVTARTYTDDLRPGGQGTFGQFIPSVTEEESFGRGDRPMQVLQMQQTDQFRSNLGLVETSGEQVTIRIRAIVPGLLSAPQVDWPLKGNEFTQLQQILNSWLGVTNVHNARVEIEAIAGDGKFTAYASVVDNRTQDPTYVPGQ